VVKRVLTMAHGKKEPAFKNLENRLDNLTRMGLEKKIVSLYSKSFPGIKTDDVTILGYGPSNGDEDDEAAYIVKYQALLPNGRVRNDTIAASELSVEPAIYKIVLRTRYDLEPKEVVKALRQKCAKQRDRVRILGVRIALESNVIDDGVIIYETMGKYGNRKGRIPIHQLFKRK
jgi:hypothetical protein